MTDYSIHHPAFVSLILDKAEKRRVIHRGLPDFVRYNLDDDEHRLMFLPQVSFDAKV